MQQSNKVILPVLFVLTVVFLSGCGIDPRTYNDSLVEMQKRAYDIDEQLDKDFEERFWSETNEEDFVKANSEEYKQFAEEYTQRYNQLIEEIKEIEDMPEEHNQMKITLIDMIEYMRDGIDNYYTKLIIDIRNGGTQISMLNQQYNEGFREHYDKFATAQDEFAEHYELQLEE